jgi:hypothetical protein
MTFFPFFHLKSTIDWRVFKILKDSFFPLAIKTYHILLRVLELVIIFSPLALKTDILGQYFHLFNYRSLKPW